MDCKARDDGSRPLLRRRIAISIVGAVVVAVLLAVELAGRRQQFVAALHSASIWILALAVLLSVVALLARSEAWRVCVDAAGGTVSRRLLFRAAGLGYLASVINGSVGMAVRIACLRRVAPNSTPRVPALVAAEVPIIIVEVGLAAIFSFTLVAPLGVSWWVPAVAVAIMVAAISALRRFSDRHRVGAWAGLAGIRKGGARMTTLVLLGVCAQIARNWLMLHAIGVNVSVFDAMALLIAMFTIGQLPIGPSVGTAAAVLILGAHGVAATAAAGVLLTVTGTIGSLGYAAWAVCDRMLSGRGKVEPEAGPAVVAVAPSIA